MWLTKHKGPTGSFDWHQGATWPKPLQVLHWVLWLEEYAVLIGRDPEYSLMEDPIGGTYPRCTDTTTKVAVLPDLDSVLGLRYLAARMRTVGELKIESARLGKSSSGSR